jgi:hypothetical protein
MQEVLAALKSDTSKSNGKGGQHPLQLQGTRESADAYDLRDFLRRSGVPFEWIELTTDAEARRDDHQQPDGRATGGENSLALPVTWRCASH